MSTGLINNIAKNNKILFIKFIVVDYSDRFKIPCEDSSSYVSKTLILGHELAFCKMFNLYPDLDTDRMPPYPEFDAVLRDGWTVDVKTTRYDDGRLLVDVRKGRKVDGVDFYCLMTGEFPGPYTFRGFMAKSVLVKPERKRVVSGHEAYAADQSELDDDPQLF